MTTADYIATQVLPAAYALLPAPMCSAPASALLMAIGWQESRFAHRRQVRGPARGYWQFERDGGVIGVMEHPNSRRAAGRVLDVLGYPPERAVIYAALEHNDVLAACWARLLLWTHPRPLPALDEATQAWAVYLSTWRPGKPHEHTWAAFYQRAWALDLPGTVRA